MTPRLVLAAALAAAGVGPACQSYEPRPLHPDAHRSAWHARLADAASLRAYLAEFEDAEARPPAAHADALAAFDAEDGLTVEEGRLVAAVFHPELRLARLRLRRAAAGAAHAGRWNDPALSFDVLRITESVPEPWILGAGLGFTVPLTGRLAAERDLAAASEAAAVRAVREREWEVDHELRRAWVAWTAARWREEENARYQRSLEPVVRSARALVEAGEITAPEAALFELERARQRNRATRLQGETRIAEQRLRAALGLAPDAPVELVPGFAVAASGAPDAAADAEDATGTAGARDFAAVAARHPRLARLREEHAVAEQRLRRAIAAQWPDLGLGPRLESEEGSTRAGIFGALPVPLWNANRRAIAEARADRELARAAHETAYEVLAGQWAAATARAESLAAQRRDLEEALVPQVERQLEDALALLRLGEGSSLVLLDALRRAHDVRMELVEARAAEARARAELAHLAGPAPRPRDTKQP